MNEMGTGRYELEGDRCSSSGVAWPVCGPCSLHRARKSAIAHRLAGGGTDVSPFCDLYGGAILNATIDSYAYATIEATDTDTVEFMSSDREESISYDSCAAIPPDGRLDLLKAVYNYIVREYNHEGPLSVAISTRVDVPAGSGLGSSSTLVVAIIKAFAEALRLPLGEYEIANAAYIIERIEAQLQGGRQDQYAATFGGFNFMEFGAGGHVS